MIGNNSKNTKYSDTSVIIYKPDSQMTKSVVDLLKFSLHGDYPNLKELLDEKDFLDSTLNLALRNLLSNYFNFNDENYLNSYRYLLSTNIDLNFKYAKDNYSTILMKVTHAGQLILMKELLESFYNKIKNGENINNFQKPEEEKEYFLIQQEIFFSQKDKNNSNFLHYMIHFNKCENSEIFEYLYEEYPFEKNREEDCSKKIQEIIKNLIKEKNDEGNNFMNICLLHGMPYLVLKIIEIIGYIPNLNKKNNNYIHSAVLGGNMTCLKIMLYYSEYNELSAKNVDNLTPAQLAYKLGYFSMSNIITEYHDNFHDQIYREYFFKNLENYDKSSNVDFLVNFRNNKFKSLFYELKEMKIINNLCISDSSYINKNEEVLNCKISNIKIDWNFLLIKMKQFEIEQEKDTDNNINIININKQGKNNKKKSRKSEDKNKIAIYPFIKSIYEFYEKNFSEILTNSFISYLSNEDTSLICNNNIDLLFFNKIIFYFNTGHFKSLINSALIYLTKIYQKESNINSDMNYNNRTLILYINITCIIIESLIYHEYKEIVDIIIKALDKYLYTKSLNLGDMQYNSNDKIIFDYLNNVGMLNPFISNWQNLFIYSNFLKLLNDKSKDNLEEFHKKLNEAKDKNIPNIIKRYQILFDCLDIKKSYDKNNFNLCKKIENFNLNQEQERDIYYFNILGIICLKKKKYNLSKIFFKIGLGKYLQKLKKKKETNLENKFVTFRMDYITAFLYNISICNFYLGEYEKAIQILELILQFENNKNNYFLYYRLALCYLEIYLKYINKNNNNYFNLIINKLIGYENNKNNKNMNNEKSISINIENESSENLSFQLESKDNNTKGTDDNKSLNLIDKQIENLFANFNDYNYVDKKDKNIKKIILRNSKKYNDIKNLKGNSQNSDFNLIEKYLDKAIQSFKKILIINKINTFSNFVNSIYEFFFSFIKDDIKTKDISHQKRRIPNDFIINIYFNILFCLSLKNNWLEIIFFIKDFNRRNLTNNKIILLKILLYQLEAYINLNQESKIKETINKIKNHKKCDFSLFDKSNNKIINNINIKLYLYYYIAIIHFKEKNYKEMDIYMNKLLVLLKDKKDIPYYIIDLLIKIFIIKLNNEPNINPKTKYKYNNIILNLIKNKKINKAD